MSDYKPGTFAMVTLDSGERVRAMRLEDEDAWRTQDDIWLDRRDGTETVSDVRPLVVLDLDKVYACHAERDPAAVVRYLRGTGSAVAFAIADQIEAQSRPPKPAEPTGLGAVVEDSEGHLWVRTDPDAPAWTRWDASLTRVSYERIDVAKKLSDGWEPKP